jgi:type III restriction/modification enzyme restriction subunit/recombinase
LPISSAPRIVTKRRDTKLKKYQGGIPFTHGPLAYLLKNRVYLGEMHHGGNWYDGEQLPIVNRDLFDQVQVMLKSNSVERVAQRTRRLQGDTNRWLQALPADYFDLILFDEGHHSVAESWETLRSRFPDARIVNFSATPLRADGQIMAGRASYIPIRFFVRFRRVTSNA